MKSNAPTGNSSLTITTRSLHDQVANRVRDLIIEAVLEPGIRIDEAKLIQDLGVSRTPFREALRTLAAEGLVIIKPSKGVVVRKLTPEDVYSMLEVLSELERLAGRRACKRASDAEIDDMVSLHERMLVHYSERDRMPYYKLNQEFHSRLAALSGNETLQEMQANLQARLKRIRYIGNEGPESWAAAVKDHEDMVVALRARDADALGEAMWVHLQRTWARVKDRV